MADLQRELNVNQRDWTTEDAGFIPADGDIWYYESHPDYTGVVYVVGDGSTVFSSLYVYSDVGQGAKTAGGVFTAPDGIEHTPGVKTSDYLQATGLTSDETWYTVLQVAGTIPGESGSADVSFVCNGTSRENQLSIHVAWSNSDQATRKQSLKLLNHSGYFAGSDGIKSVRISNDAVTTGRIIQILCDIDTALTVNTLLTKNISSSGGSGLRVVSPVANENLPGGGTASQFIVAGDIYTIEYTGSNRALPCVAFKNGGSTITFTLPWGEKPLLDANTITPLGTGIKYSSGGLVVDITAYTWALKGITVNDEIIVEVTGDFTTTAFPFDTAGLIQLTSTSSNSLLLTRV